MHKVEKKKNAKEFAKIGQVVFLIIQLTSKDKLLPKCLTFAGVHISL